MSVRSHIRSMLARAMAESSHSAGRKFESKATFVPFVSRSSASLSNRRDRAAGVRIASVMPDR